MGLVEESGPFSFCPRLQSQVLDQLPGRVQTLSIPAARYLPDVKPISQSINSHQRIRAQTATVPFDFKEHASMPVTESCTPHPCRPRPLQNSFRFVPVEGNHSKSPRRVPPSSHRDARHRDYRQTRIDPTARSGNTLLSLRSLLFARGRCGVAAACGSAWENPR